VIFSTSLQLSKLIVIGVIMKVSINFDGNETEAQIDEKPEIASGNYYYNVPNYPGSKDTIGHCHECESYDFELADPIRFGHDAVR
jgi:hypothetical protein